MAEFQRYVYELWHFASHSDRASRAFGLPPPKAAGAKRIIFSGGSPNPLTFSLRK